MMTKNLRAIAIDDEPKALDVIRLHISKVPFIELNKRFRDPIEALSWLQDHEVDLIFLDINMPKISGLKLRKLIGNNFMIIFTTAYSEYAVESYEHRAIDYLLKPITFERFLQAALKAKEWTNYQKDVETQTESSNFPAHSRHQIFIKSGTKHYKLYTDDILFFEKDGNYVVIHTEEKKILSRLNMNQVLELVPYETFIKVHKSFIINIQHISSLESHQLEVGKHKIPVAKTYREMLKKKFYMT